MKYLLLTFWMLLAIIGLHAQSNTVHYEKEKIYIQTDHVFFAPGETLFFKLYLVKGASNKPSDISKVVHVDIYGPSGTLVEAQTYPIEPGGCEGSFTPGANAVGGIYKLKAYTSWMLNEKDSMLFTKQFTVQKIVSPRILMKLEFPKKGYASGDEVVADFSMRSLDDQPISFHEGQFTVSLAGVVQNTRSFSTDAEGKARISFSLPPNLQTIDGLLNITVTDNSYTESISRSIPITLNNIDLQFLPEGGNFVEGLATNLAFKAINEYGNPVDVSGVIKDNTGQTVASFNSYKFGMGQLPFNPLPGKIYTATITSPVGITQQYALPKAASGGIVLNITHEKGEIDVKLLTTRDGPVTLVEQTKGITGYSQTIQLKKGENHLALVEDSFPAGIARFTILAANNSPLAERIVFLNADHRLHVTLTPDKEKYLPREKVTMVITTKNEKDIPVPADLSLSVVDDKLWTLADDKQDNILSWLLLSSELKGKIEEPQFYFKEDEPKAPLALELLMLTNGYRYFDLIDEVQESRTLKFNPEETNIVSGTITDISGHPSPANLFLVHNVFGGEVQQQRVENGQFWFSNLHGKDNYLLLVKPINKKQSVRIALLQNGIGAPLWRGDSSKIKRIDDRFDPIIRLSPAPAPAPAKQPAQTPLLLQPFRSNSSSLEDVVVTAYGMTSQRLSTGAITTIKPDLVAVPANDVMQALQGRVAGLVVTTYDNPGQTPQVVLRGGSSIPSGNEPLFVVNGVPQEKYNWNGINVDDIAYVTIIKDASATALYGSRAANGVIQMETKKYLFERLRWPIKDRDSYITTSFIANGMQYTVARRFYTPHYSSTATSDRNDFRPTIYWNPSIHTNADGKASIEFYNSDATTTFRVLTEGIGANGQPGVTEKTYAAQAAISIDAKIPPYLTTGDKALIPVVIKNNSSDAFEGTLNLSLPAHMSTGQFDKVVTLAPGATQQLLIPLSATAPTDGAIGLHLTGNLAIETITLPITAVQKGFPIIETFTGNNTTNHSFKINQVIPGTLQAKLVLYQNFESQLLDGITSMLREPYGCFEQTSSTTYPNIFILKYLRQTGRSNPEIEKKAMDYIERGYKRLIGFETAQNGFEWFGRTPPHEPLTAYGLMEFTDMKELIAVDNKMLQRTKNFLLKRRDGKGGFLLAEGHYYFATAPNEIANTYIVYALTQAGYGQEFLPEYAKAFTKALQSKDAYQLAMMALAADNMKDSGDYNRLMDLLKAEPRLQARSSIVSSGQASLRIETYSLYALALMRRNHPDIERLSGLISRILSQRVYYGYGSTQATVLALRAICEYYGLIDKEIRQSEIHFMVNGHPVAITNSLAPLFKEGLNHFNVKYSDDKKGLPYQLEVAYHTLTPLNNDNVSLRLHTTLNNIHPRIGETVRLTIEVNNKKDSLLPMAIAKIGIPAGLSLQPWQLKELADKNKVAYYELFDNYLVFYWMGFAPQETKTVALDLKAEVPGSYKAKASNAYLYYTPEYKHWQEGLDVNIEP